MNIKKLISCSIAGLSVNACVLASMSGAMMNADAAFASSADRAYTVSGDYAIISNYKGSKEIVTVPATINGYTVKEIADDFLSNNDTVTTVTVSAGIEKIGNNFCNRADNLRNIYIKNGVKSIGDSFCKSAENLVNVFLPYTLESIGSYGFYGCDLDSNTEDTRSFNKIYIYDSNDIPRISSSDYASCLKLNSIGYATLWQTDWEDQSGNLILGQYLYRMKTLNSASGFNSSTGALNLTNVNGRCIQYIGDGAISGKTNIKSVNLNAVLKIGANAFNYCESLISVTIPEGVTSIGNYAFYYCDSLTSVTIPDGVASIGILAFTFCDALTTITIPYSVTSIGGQAFGYCKSLVSITIENPDCEINDSSSTIANGYDDFTGTIYGYEGSTAQTYAETYDITFVAIEILASGECGENLTWTLYADGLLTISGTGAMYDWNSSSDVPWYDYQDTITEVVINDGAESIGDYAFYGCALTSITIPDGVKSIGESAFNCCEILSSIEIPDSVVSIGDYAFAFCYDLDIDTIGNGNTIIGNYAFEFCDSLTSITIFGSDIGNNAFYICLGLNEVTISDSVTSIGDSAFGSCRSLSTVTIGNGVTSIGNSAFYYCDALTSVTIGESVTHIEDFAFNYCSALESIVFPDSVTTIGGGAFQMCTSLTDLIVPSNVSVIDDYAFNKCEALNSITIENPECEIYDVANTIPDNATIHGYINSTAHTYAEKYDRTFAALDAIAYGKYSDTLSWALMDDNTLVITGTGDMPDWDLTTAAPWSEYSDRIYYVEIGEGITSVGDRAFENYTYLRKVKIPDTVTRIGSKAFYGCGMLEILRLPESVATIDSMALSVIADGAHIYIYNSDCEIYDSENTIGTNTIIHGLKASTASVHANSYDIRFVEIAELPVTGVYDVLTYEQYSDHIEIIDCDHTAEYVEIPSEIDGIPVTVIGHSAFAWCEGLSAALPYGITSIGDAAFRNSGIGSLSLPDTLLTIGNSAFAGTMLTSITIPNSVCRIGEKAFYGCGMLGYAELSENLFKLEDNTFYGCASLDSVTFPAKMMFLPANLFGGCGNLITLKIMNPDCVIYTNDFAISPVVYGYDDSTAETFADENDFMFVPFESENTFDAGIITLDYYERPRGFFGRTLALFNTMVTVDESEEPAYLDVSYLYGTNVFENSVVILSELTLELGKNDKFIVFGDINFNNFGPAIVNNLEENIPEMYKFSEKPMIFSSGAITSGSRFEIDNDVNIYCKYFDGSQMNTLDVNGNIYCYDQTSESVLQNYSTGYIHGNFYTAGSLTITAPAPNIATVIEGDLVVEGDLTLYGSLQVNGNIYVGGTLNVYSDPSNPYTITCAALYANVYTEGSADLSGVYEVYANDMFMDYASWFVFDPETSDQLLARDLSIDRVSGLYGVENPFEGTYEEYYGCDCEFDLHTPYSLVQPPMIAELSKVNYMEQIDNKLYNDPMTGSNPDHIYADYIYSDASIPEKLDTNAVIQGTIQGKEIYIDPVYSDIYIFMEDVVLQNSTFIVNNDAPFNCYFVVDGDIRFETQSAIVTSQYYNQILSGIPVEVLSEEDNVNIYIYMRNEDYYGIDTVRTRLYLSNESYITGHIRAPFSDVDIEGGYYGEFYYDNVYSEDISVYPRASIIGSVFASRLTDMNDSAILYVSDKRDQYESLDSVTPEFTEDEILDSTIQPELSAPIITLTESEADSAGIIPIDIYLNGSEDSWNNIKFHLDYDSRLWRQTDEYGNPKYTVGFAAEQLYMKSAGCNDDTDYPSLYFAASGDENANQGTDGLIVTFYLSLPSNAAAGDIYALDLNMVDGSDVFTNYENDTTGQLMQAYLCEYGLTDGYIQIIEDEVQESTSTTTVTTTSTTATTIKSELTTTAQEIITTIASDITASSTAESATAAVTTTQPYENIVWSGESVNATAGDTLSIDITVNGENYLPVAGVEFAVSADYPLNLISVNGSQAYNAYISKNSDLNIYSFSTSSGGGVSASDGGVVMSLTFEIPVSCPSGNYAYYISNISAYDKNGNDISQYIAVSGGNVAVKALTTTTTTTTTIRQTTTSTTATTTTAVITTTSGQEIENIELQIGETVEIEGIPRNQTLNDESYTGSKNRPLLEINKDGIVTALNSGTKVIESEDETKKYIITVLEPTLDIIGSNVFTCKDDKIVFEIGNLSEEQFGKWSIQLRDENNRNQHSLNNSDNMYFNIEKSGLNVTVSLKAAILDVPVNKYKLILVSPNASGSMTYEYDLRFTVDPAVILGDVDFDGIVNASDASMVLAEYALLATKGEPTFVDIQKKAADVNTDGSTDASDASSILGYYAYIATGGSGTMEEYLGL